MKSLAELAAAVGRSVRIVSANVVLAVYHVQVYKRSGYGKLSAMTHRAPGMSAGQQ